MLVKFLNAKSKQNSKKLVVVDLFVTSTFYWSGTKKMTEFNVNLSSATTFFYPRVRPEQLGIVHTLVAKAGKK